MSEIDHESHVETSLPRGTVTFLFTDIEGSTRLLERLHEQYAALLEEQRGLMRAAFTSWNGFEIDTKHETYARWNFFAMVLIE